MHIYWPATKESLYLTFYIEYIKKYNIVSYLNSIKKYAVQNPFLFFLYFFLSDKKKSENTVDDSDAPKHGE